MSEIRRQSIISSAIVYIGFALGILNTYLFTKEGGFTKEQYGLTGAFMAIAQVMFSVASLGMPAFIYKFFPYYNAHLPKRKSELLTMALLVSIAGFLLVIAGGYIFKDLVFKSYANSPQVITYYKWLFPFGFGLTLFSVLEAYGWAIHRSVSTNLLREVIFRLVTTFLFLFTVTGIIRTFDGFVHLYSFGYLFVALVLFIYLLAKKEAAIVFSISRVTVKFRKKILALVSYVWGGGMVYNISSVFDTIVIAAVLPDGLAYAGIYTLGQYMCSLIQAPQRAIIAASVGPLSQAWKDKDYDKIKRIYQRSAINQLIFACAMFCLLWLNFYDGIKTFHLQGDYTAAFPVFFYIGIMRIIDLGTGLNSQIIGTSTYWRFEFTTGVILLALALPLNYKLTQHYQLIGPAISNLIAFSIYNLIRYLFLWRKFGMQPFTMKTVYTLIIATLVFVISYFSFEQKEGLIWIIIRSGVFILLYFTAVFSLKLTPDLIPVIQTVKKRLGLPT